MGIRMKKNKRNDRIKWGWLIVPALLLTACTSVEKGTTATSSEDGMPGETTEIVQEIVTVQETEMKEVTTEAIRSEELPAETEMSDETVTDQPVGHQIHYTKGEETYGWTRYEYDVNGRKTMIIFISPRGDEYWSPIFYDGNGHVIPETVGDWTTLDKNGLHLQVGTEDNRGHRTLMAEYAYDDKGNLTDYWYMYVNGSFQRHMVYQYDSKDRMIREETYYVRSNKLLSYVEYIYNSEDFLIRKNEVEDANKKDAISYFVYQYNEAGQLIREEQVRGGMVHDYIEYTYSDKGVLLSEYHYLEDPMMGGPYTVEYLFELPLDSAG